MARGISIRNVRSATYAFGKGLGDVSAITRGDIVPRIVRRVAGKFTGRGLRIFD